MTHPIVQVAFLVSMPSPRPSLAVAEEDEHPPPYLEMGVAELSVTPQACAKNENEGRRKESVDS